MFENHQNKIHIVYIKYFINSKFDIFGHLVFRYTSDTPLSQNIKIGIRTQV